MDSSVYGAAIEDEASYAVDTDRYWDTVYSKALLRMPKKLEIFGCPPVEEELSEAPERMRRRLLDHYRGAKSLRPSVRVLELQARYTHAGIFPPDALIASYASLNKLDALITVNRRHLKRADSIRKISAINKRLRLRPLLILLPGELLELLP